MSDIQNRNWRNALQDGKYWLLGALITGAIGLFLGFLGVMAIGVGVSGSGCGSQCMESVETVALFGQCFLALAFIAAILSIGATWKYQANQMKTWVSVVITVINLFILLLAGSSIAFLAYV